MRRCTAINPEFLKVFWHYTVLFSSITIFSLFFSGCAAPKTPPVTTSEAFTEAKPEICHLRSMEVELPDGWAGTGNTTKFCQSDSCPTTYMLIGEDCDPETDIAKTLELFLGQDFYKDRVQFVYGTSDGESVSGILLNERLNKNYCFFGYYLKRPKAYIFCLSSDLSQKDRVKELAEYVYESRTVP